MGRVRRFLTESPWPATLALLVPAALWIAIGLGLQWSRGVIDTQPWFHPIPPRGSWIPWVHPPGYAEFMYWTQRASDTFWVSEGLLIFVQRGVLAAGLAAAFAHELGRRAGVWPAVLAGALFVLSPTALRPFEHYPLSAAAATVGLLAAARFAREGGRVAAAVAFSASLLSVMLHLSCWFLVGPALAALAVAAEPRRRRGTVLLTAALIGAFLFFATPDLFRVLFGTGPALDRSQPGVIDLRNITFEWNNPWLWAPAALWLLPGVRFARREGLALVFGLAAYTGITFWMQWQAYVIGGNRISGHHYFELIDPVACWVAALALAAGVRATEGHARGAALRGLLGIGVAALLAVHLWLWLRGAALLEQLALYPG